MFTSIPIWICKSIFVTGQVWKLNPVHISPPKQIAQIHVILCTFAVYIDKKNKNKNNLHVVGILEEERSKRMRAIQNLHYIISPRLIRHLILSKLSDLFHPSPDWTSVISSYFRNVHEPWLHLCVYLCL